MSCGLNVNVPDDVQRSFKEFRSGNGLRWMTFKLNMSNTTLELAETGPSSDTFDDFVEKAFKDRKPLYAYVHFQYDLGMDGKRSKLVRFLYVPGDATVREKMLMAAGSSTTAKILGQSSVTIAASDMGDFAFTAVLEKCKAISH